MNKLKIVAFLDIYVQWNNRVALLCVHPSCRQGQNPRHCIFRLFIHLCVRTCKQSSYRLLRRVKLMYVMLYRLHAARVDDFVGALKQLHVDFHWPFPVLSLSALQHVASGLSTLCMWGSLWAPGHNAPLIRFRHYIYCLLVCIEYFPTYPFFFTFPYLSPPLLIISFENRPAPFPGRML